MKRRTQVGLALMVDALLGDPQWLPHPAKLTGKLAHAAERETRSRVHDERLAGLIAAGAVVGSAGLAALVITALARRLGRGAEDLASVALFWTAFAARDLASHAVRVHEALDRGDLAGARGMVGRMVGRDVAVLDEAGVVRAAVESVAENMVDGVTAPVLYAYLGGPVAAAVYKAASTLDSTFGYRNERYIRFGWASARLDDVLNYVPARLTAPALCLATAVLGGSPRRVLQVSLRDGRKHASPNSGFAEAGMAGALGVQLGGPLVRDGRQTDLPTLGDPERPLVRGDILLATRLLVVTTAIWAGALDGMAKISERWSRKRTTGSLRLPPPPLRRL